MLAKLAVCILLFAFVFSQQPPVNTCCYKFANPQLPAVTLPQPLAQADYSLTPNNPIVLSNGNALSQGCNGARFEYYNQTQWVSTYINKNGQVSTIDNFYANSASLMIRTIQSQQSNLPSVLNGKYARLTITCNNGYTSCVQFKIGGSSEPVTNALCGTPTPVPTTTVAPRSPCVSYENPPGAISTTGTWSILARVLSEECTPIYVAGMRGITPNNNTQVSLTQPNGLYLRVKQAFLNMLFNAEQFGARASDCVRVVVFVRDMVSIRPIVNQVQAELWAPVMGSNLRYPPRTILELEAFNGLTCEYPNDAQKWRQGSAGANGQVVCEQGGIPIGDILEVEGTFYVRQ